MRERPWYKRFGGDFVMGTMGMSLEERGAYSLLIDLQHDRGQPLPDDARYLANIMGISTRRWRTIRDRLIGLGKIDERDGFLSNKRVEIDLEKASNLKKIRADAGSVGGRKSGTIRNKNKTISKANTSGLSKQNGSKSAVRAYEQEARVQNLPLPSLSDDPPARPTPKAAAGCDPQLAQETHDRMIRITGADPARSPAWMQTGAVRTWLAEGIEPGTIITAVEGVMAKREGPPRSPNYFTDAVRERHGRYGGGIDPAEADRQQRRARVKAHANGVPWGADWGAPPTNAELNKLNGEVA